jgi:hypothetical protein
MALDVPSSGFDTVCQKYIQSRPIASNFYKKSALARSSAPSRWATRTRIQPEHRASGHRRDPLRCGHPARREDAARLDQRVRPAHSGLQDPEHPRAGRLRRPSGHREPADALPSQADQYGAGFRWGEIVTEITISTKTRCAGWRKGTKDGAGLAAVDGLHHATEVAMQDHIDALIENLWNGNPASQTASLWKSASGNPFTAPGFCLGVLQMTSATNTYGRIDRSNADNARCGRPRWTRR